MMGWSPPSQHSFEGKVMTEYFDKNQNLVEIDVNESRALWLHLDVKKGWCLVGLPVLRVEIV